MFRSILPIFLCLSLAFCTTATAQLNESEKATIATLEGFPPMLFEAPDLSGEKHFLGDYKEKVMVLFFFNNDCTDCVPTLNMLNKVKAELNSEDLVIIGLMDDKAEVAKTFAAKNKIDFPVIPDVLELSNMAYGGDKLPNPRTLIIDKFGVIKNCLVKTGDEQETYNKLKEGIMKQLK